MAPYAPNSDFVDHDDVWEGFRFHSFIVKELVPFVRNYLHGSSDPDKNLISGNSMGCAATWQFGLAHPDLFGYVGPLCNQPLDYKYLEPFRNMSGEEFREYASEHPVRTAYGIDSGTMHAKELSSICRYPTVGAFLDSYENTFARFQELAEKHNLPKIFLSGADSECRWGAQMASFHLYCEKNEIQNIVFDMYRCETHNSAFWEESVERFLDYAGIVKLRDLE